MTQPDREHIGPVPQTVYAGGRQTVHAQIHEAAVGKTIKHVYLGEDKPIPPSLPQSEYLVLEFTDGSVLGLQVGAGYSFVAVGEKTARALSPHLAKN